jgi:hypothetical protein
LCDFVYEDVDLSSKYQEVRSLHALCATTCMTFLALEHHHLPVKVSCYGLMLCRDVRRGASLRVEAVARPQKQQTAYISSTARHLTRVHSYSSTSSAPLPTAPPSSSQGASRQGVYEGQLVVDAAETHAHNSFYLPAHTWSETILVVRNSSWTCSELGPNSTTQYGM